MAQPRATIVLSASIDNEEAVKAWLASVREAADTAQASIEHLGDLMREGVHLAITLRRHPPPDDPDAGRRGD